MNKEKLKEMLKKRQELKQRLEIQYYQLLGQITLLEELIKQFEEEKNNRNG